MYYVVYKGVVYKIGYLTGAGEGAAIGAAQEVEDVRDSGRHTVR